MQRSLIAHGVPSVASGDNPAVVDVFTGGGRHLEWKKGGLVKQSHDEIKFELQDLAPEHSSNLLSATNHKSSQVTRKRSHETSTATSRER